jgi:hypothetical protein
MSSVEILGNRELFSSKTAIKRLKKDIKNESKLEPSDYLIDGYTFRVSKDNKKDTDIKNYKVVLMTLDEYASEEKRRQLKQRIKTYQKVRGGAMKREMASLKRSIPDKIFKAYQDLLKVGTFKISPPDEIINNIEKHKMQIAMINGNPGIVSNNSKANSAIKKYFKVLGDFLNIEPVKIKDPTPPTNNVPSVKEDIDSDTEEEPELVSI